MHKDLQALLHSAQGHSRHVVVVFLDVRGFSSFAKIAGSSDTAEFLKSAYIRILDDYVSGAHFFKLTGDGLLVMFEYDHDSLTSTVREAVDLSIRLVEDFPAICDQDPMVNFEVPANLGVGLARGAATSLTSGSKVLDYSGRPLNLASRLMDLARPSGVVFDESFGFDLLEEEVQERFTPERVYVKGIAEDDPITAYCLVGHTDVPAYNKSPMNRLRRHTEPTVELSVKDLRERGTYRHLLSLEPARTDDIDIHVEWPKARANGTKHPKLKRILALRGEYVRAQNKHYASLSYPPVVGTMTESGAKSTWKVKVTVEYSVREDG